MFEWKENENHYACYKDGEWHGCTGKFRDKNGQYMAWTKRANHHYFGSLEEAKEFVETH